MTIRTIRELDELPEGTEIEILDNQGTRRLKVGGRWRWAIKRPGSTWNVNTYVNVRRWGVRVIERGIE
ncbi:hypothetical protein [Streptomyces sp. H34-S4]|uniref:hypothetical protein n=1 Tax=Streptomyces sp. H34-S4 TaxID=2996463 RepID=UPI0022704DDB|nr:hypothetical protein [Streptomyces sp. H34-S4]MCY0933665.1 hypothetical protein [Streptomyces sp. H34-S4]